MGASTDRITTLLASAWRTRTSIDTIDAVAPPSDRDRAAANFEAMGRLAVDLD